MDASDLRPVTITLVHEGRSLLVSLSDARSVGRLAQVAIDASELLEMQAQAAYLLQPAITPLAPAGGRIRALGTQIFSRLFPDSIGEYLMRSPSRYLSLQMSAGLTGIPWEIAFDGAAFLAEKFLVSRQILCDQDIPGPPARRAERDTLTVLIINGNAAAHPAGLYAEALLRKLDILEGLCTTAVSRDDLHRDDLLRLIGQHTVVHYVGPVCGGSLAAGEVNWWRGGRAVSVQDMARLSCPPKLLVSENADGQCICAEATGNRPVAHAACRAGLNILACELGTAGEDRSDFMQAAYYELARGAAVAEAIARAQAAGRRRGGCESLLQMSAVLYGDATLALVPQVGRARSEDHLRQVTMMSFDLVGSTALLGTMGAERYSELLADYHARCASIVARYGGVSDDPQGDDGVMCYFGFPIAREDAARQALHAGLAIIAAVAQLGVCVRIGVATGQVVVKAGQPVGVTVHLAARLQSIAEPGTLVTSEATRQIAKDGFEFLALVDIPQLKGFERPGAVYRVLGEARADAAQASATAPKQTPFIGRGREFEQLEEHWRVACTGSVRTVLISGDAGIGKSRLVREFRRALTARGQASAECRCNSGHTISAFHALIDLLSRHVQIQDSDSVDAKLDKIQRSLAPDLDVGDAIPLIAGLFSIPYETRYRLPEYTPQRQRQLTLDLLVKWFSREALRAPSCVIIEDIQWIDPSTEEFLNRVIAEAVDLPLLILVTQRSDGDFRWTPGVAVHPIELKGLSPECARSMVIGASGPAKLPGEIVRMLAARADGVPLFIEESTRMAVDLGVGTGSDTGAAMRFTVPATIHDLLMARLDRLGTAKQVAQLGGTLGREFSLQLLEAVLAHESSPMRIDNLTARLAVLVKSGLLIQKSEAPEASYTFKHALIRDTAYQSLLERDRKRLHRTIAMVMSEKFLNLAETRPELLAHHYAQAGNDADAMVYWERAARRAASRSEHHEGIGHLKSALELVARLPRASECDRVELRLQLMLASRFIATEGYGADQVERVYARASELCKILDDEAALMKVQLGLEGYHFMRGDFEKAHTIAQQAATMAQRSPNPMHKLQSTWAVANILFHQGELRAAVDHMDRCLSEYDKLQHRPSGVQDPGVMCLCYSAWGMWELGYPDQALERARQVVTLSEELGHKFSMGEAYGFCTTVHHFRGETAAALKCAERAMEICEEGGFAVWLAHAKLMHGRLLAEQGETAQGVEEMRLAYEMWTVTGAVVTRPFYLAMQAEGLALAGRPDEGLALLETAFEIVQQCGERYYEAEIRRLFGEMILQSAALHGTNRSQEAEHWLRGALESAQARQLHSLALRSGLSFARLSLSQRRREEAIYVIEPIYARFKEGLNTRDVIAARGLLTTMRPVGAVH